MIYLDTSALLKLVFEEPESAELAAWIGERESLHLVSSELARIEVSRATMRVDPSALPVARSLLAGVDLLRMTSDVVDEACSIGDLLLRSLDAIHLASAWSIRSDLTAFVAYDTRLIDAARSAGIPLTTPGHH